MPVKKAEGQTILTFVRLFIIFIALLGSWNMQFVANAVFGFVRNADVLVRDFISDEPSLSTIEGRPYVLYYAERSNDDKSISHIYKKYYITGEEGNLGLKDSSGQALIDGGFEDILVLPDAYLLKHNDSWGFYARDLQPLSDARWETAELELSDDNNLIVSDLVKIKRDGMYGAADMLGNVLVEPQYEEFDPYTFEANWSINRVKKDGYYGYIDRNGRTVIDLIYDYVIMSSIVIFKDADDEEGTLMPVVFVLKDEDWGGMLKQRDGSPGRVDWEIEPPAEVLADYAARL